MVEIVHGRGSWGSAVSLGGQVCKEGGLPGPLSQALKLALGVSQAGKDWMLYVQAGLGWRMLCV